VDFLPEKWQWRDLDPIKEERNVPSTVIAAHVIHHTSAILIHQRIAYGPKELNSISMAQTSQSSLGECENAIKGILLGIQKYLKEYRKATCPKFSLFLSLAYKYLHC
jgi:hypothetical protein